MISVDGDADAAVEARIWIGWGVCVCVCVRVRVRVRVCVCNDGNREWQDENSDFVQTWFRIQENCFKISCLLSIDCNTDDWFDFVCQQLWKWKLVRKRDH